MTLTLSKGAAALACALACFAGGASAADAPVRDGSHDFDFAKGVWHTHTTQVKDPFDGGTQVSHMDGTKTATALWGGKAWVEEIEADGPSGHWEGMTLFTYTPKTGEWRQTYIDGDDGVVDPSSVGSFKDGVGELYGTTTYKGRQVLVREVWSDIKPDFHHFEIYLSQDGGRTWATRFKADLTRIK